MFQRRSFFIIVFCVLCVLPVAAQKQALTISPEHPKLGETITISYDPTAPGARLKMPLNVTLILKGYARPSVRNEATSAKVFDMKFVGGAWWKRFVFTDSLYLYYTLYVMERPGVIDDNKGLLWDIMMFGEDEHPLPNANLAKYFALQDINPPDLRRRQMEALQDELSTYPDNFRGRYVQSIDELKTSAHPGAVQLELSRRADFLMERYPDDLGALVFCSNAYRILGDTLTALHAESLILTNFPGSQDAEVLQFSNAFHEPDPDRRIFQLREMLKEYPNSAMADIAFDTIDSCLRNKDDTLTLATVKSEWSESKKGKVVVDPAFNVDVITKTLQNRHKIESPDFTFDELDSSKVSRNDYAGKVLVLEFWSSACKACQDLFPVLQKLYDNSASRPKVAILTVNTRSAADSTQAINQYFHDNHYTLPCALDKAAIASRFGVVAIPTTIILDEAGFIAYRKSGVFTPDEYEKTVNTVIDFLVQEH